jgi:chaperonin cofactor prefoldin
MSNIIEYKIVEKGLLKELENTVNEMISISSYPTIWKPIGGVIVITDSSKFTDKIFYQAMALISIGT